MATFNRVILVGNLTREPELRRTPSGVAVANMRMAINETYRDRQTGQPREVVCYVDVAAWDRQAETCNQYLSKGSPVLVEGRLVYDEWKNQQGETRSRVSVRADRVQFLGTPPGVEARPAGGPAAAPQSGRAAPPAPSVPPPPPASAGGGEPGESQAGDGYTGGDYEDPPF